MPSAAPRRTISPPPKTAIHLVVYDLLPPGRLSTSLWTLGLSLLHTSVRISSREYAFGGHDHPGTTGVYVTKPHIPPPGATFKTEILHGFTYMSESEISEVIAHAAREFQGTGYDLLTRNCNHFSSWLCERLTGRPAPGWVNRAAEIGVRVPCVLPRAWVEPPRGEVDEEEVGLMGRRSGETEEMEMVRGVGGGRDDRGRELPASESLELRR